MLRDYCHNFYHNKKVREQDLNITIKMGEGAS